MDESAAAAAAPLQPPDGLDDPQAHGNALMVVYTTSCVGLLVAGSAVVDQRCCGRPAVSTVPRLTAATQQLSDLGTPVS